MTNDEVRDMFLRVLQKNNSFPEDERKLYEEALTKGFILIEKSAHDAAQEFLHLFQDREITAANPDTVLIFIAGMMFGCATKSFITIH